MTFLLCCSAAGSEKTYASSLSSTLAVGFHIFCTSVDSYMGVVCLLHGFHLQMFICAWVAICVILFFISLMVFFKL
jgi:hypothetical protein